jgi:RNA polymerase sigma-70 factor (ECF subfamily)
LVRRLREGDVSAFEWVYDTYYERLWRFAYSFVRTRAIAQEVVHDIFLTLWSGRETLSIHTTLDGYLYGAVRNHALKLVRHERVVAREASDALVQHRSPASSAPAEGVQETLEHRELIAALGRAVAELPERHRTAIVLRWRHGMRYEEIATVLAVSPQAARTLILRVQQTLKTVLSQTV